jgi:fumarate reductase subunit C
MQKKVLPNIKMYKRRMNIFWWANRWIHVKFIARELTSVCVAVYAIVLLFYVRAIATGSEAFDKILEIMQSPLVIAMHILLLGGLLFHSITWFNLAPKAMVIKLGDKNVPGVVIALMNYAGWVVISVVLVRLIIGK